MHGCMFTRVSGLSQVSEPAKWTVGHPTDTEALGPLAEKETPTVDAIPVQPSPYLTSVHGWVILRTLDKLRILQMAISNLNQPVKNRVLPMREVISITGLSRATIYRRVQDGTLIAPLKISTRKIGWLSDDIEAWLAGLQRTR